MAEPVSEHSTLTTRGHDAEAEHIQDAQEGPAGKEEVDLKVEQPAEARLSQQEHNGKASVAAVEGEVGGTEAVAVGAEQETVVKPVGEKGGAEPGPEPAAAPATAITSAADSLSTSHSKDTSEREDDATPAVPAPNAVESQAQPIPQPDDTQTVDVHAAQASVEAPGYAVQQTARAAATPPVPSAGAAHVAQVPHAPQPQPEPQQYDAQQEQQAALQAHQAAEQAALLKQQQQYQEQLLLQQQQQQAAYQQQLLQQQQQAAAQYQFQQQQQQPQPAVAAGQPGYGVYPSPGTAYTPKTAYGFEDGQGAVMQQAYGAYPQQRPVQQQQAYPYAHEQQPQPQAYFNAWESPVGGYQEGLNIKRKAPEHAPEPQQEELGVGKRRRRSARGVMERAADELKNELEALDIIPENTPELNSDVLRRLHGCGIAILSEGEMPSRKLDSGSLYRLLLVDQYTSRLEARSVEPRRTDRHDVSVQRLVEWWARGRITEILTPDGLRDNCRIKGWIP